MTNGMHCYRDDHVIYREVEHARLKAHEKHGADSIKGALDSRPLDLLVPTSARVVMGGSSVDGRGDH